MKMGKEEYEKYVREFCSNAVDNAISYLKPMSLSLDVDWDYDEWEDNTLTSALGCYEAESVFSGTISIAFNIDNMLKSYNKCFNDYPWLNTGIESIRDAVYTTVYHEMGHGLCELIFDYLTTSDCLDEVFNSQQRLFRHSLDNEEESVETFAWNMLDGNLEQDEINEMTELYIQYLKTA